MIQNKPSFEVYEKQCVRFFIQSIKLILASPFNTPGDKDYLDEANCNEEDYWNYHQGVLQNSLVLLFLSIENYLKMSICKITPLLLLEDAPRDWKTITTDRDFEKLFMKQFDDLFALYLELGLGKLDPKTISKLSTLKDNRNKIIHGVLQENITPQYIFGVISDFLTYLWNDGNWWAELKEHLFNEPLFGIYDTDFEQASVIKYIDCFVKYLGLKDAGVLFGTNFKQRRYYCPSCHYALNHDWDYSENKYAVLVPNTPKSEFLYCPVCDEKHKIMRMDCKGIECKGNVIDEDGLCLSCLEDNSDVNGEYKEEKSGGKT
jgi:hypothetical protein